MSDAVFLKGERPMSEPTDPKAHILRAARLRWPEVLVWLIALSAFFVFPTYMPLLSQIAIVGLFAVSLDLILGFAGIVSLGHAAFFGLGAYTAGLLGKHGWHEPITGLLISGLLAAAVGALTSLLVLRGSDLTRIMVTVGVAAVLHEMANKLTWLTGGSDGLTEVVIAPIFGIWEFDIFGTVAYGYSLAVLAILMFFARRLVQAPLGLTLRGLRDNPTRLLALGSPVKRRLIVVYTISALYAGIAGALLAQTTQFVSLDVLAFNRSAEVLLMVVLGGSGYLYGGLIGAVVLMVANKLLADLTPEYWQFWIGGLFVILMLFARGGLLGLGKQLIEKWEARK